jgi:signal transduction histidine kinase
MPRRASKVTLRAWIGFAIIVLLVGATAFTLNRQLAAVAEARAAAEATAERIDRLNLLLIQMLDVEAGQRGYIITADPSFLEPYRASASRVAGTLQSIMRDARLDGTEDGSARLGRLVEAKLAYVNRTIQLRDEQGLLAASAEISRAEGKRLMDAIRAEIARMARVKRERLAERTMLSDVQERRSQRIIYASLIGTLALTLAVGLMLLLQLRRRLDAEREVRRAARLLQITLDNVGVGAAVIDPDGRVIVRNAELVRLLPEVEADDTPPGLAEELALAREGRPFLLERAVGAATVIVRGVALPNDRFLITLLDVSEARRAEQVKSEFVSTVSHELRTPVTSIRGSLGMLAGPLAAGLPDKHRSLIELAMRNAERLSLLVNDILDIEKIESGRMEFSFEACDVNRLLREAAETNRAYADARDVTLALGTLPRPLLVWADPHRIQQVMSNLISNAVKFSEPGGIVTITAEAGPAHARIMVNDNGPGIPENFRDRIFQRFAQADASDARAKSGTGLGLSIAKAIVEKHGGELGFDSRPGNTNFGFTVPLCSSDPRAPDAADPARAEQGASCR